MIETPDIQIISLPSNRDNRGFLTYFENHNQIPFKITGSFLITDFRNINSNEDIFRFKINLLIPLCGSAKLVINRDSYYKINQPKSGYLLRKNVKWHIENQDDNMVLLIAYGE